ncbi:hypothetical protein CAUPRSCDRAFT_10556 [Caulochytrium protostelioides]|nr:hypothetical protein CAUPRSCDRAFT_10556 [Caulochytrium protostelioides]
MGMAPRTAAARPVFGGFAAATPRGHAARSASASTAPRPQATPAASSTATPGMAALATATPARSQRVFLNSTTHALTLEDDLPDAVKAMLTDAPLPHAPLTDAIVDIPSGYAALALPDGCLVWRRATTPSAAAAGAIAPSTGCQDLMRLPMPVAPPGGDALGHRHNTLVMFTPSRVRDGLQLGLLAVSPQGVIRHWDNLQYGRESFREIQIELSPDDACAHLVSAGYCGLVLGTRNGLVYQITLSDGVADAAISFQPLLKDGGSRFARLQSLFGMGGSSSAHAGDAGAPSAAALAEPSARELVALAVAAPVPSKAPEPNRQNTRTLHVLFADKLEVWTLFLNQDPRFVRSLDCAEPIAQTLSIDLGADSEGDEEDAGLTDEDEDEDAGIACRVLDLVSLQGAAFEAWLLIAMLNKGQTRYAAMLCREAVEGGVMSIRRKIYLQYSGPPSDYAMSDAMHLTLLRDDLALVVGSDFFVMTSLDPQRRFEEPVEFREGHTAQILHAVATSDASASLFTYPLGRLVLDVFEPPRAAPSHATSTTAATGLPMSGITRPPGTAPGDAETSVDAFRSRLEQAVFYGAVNQTQNPISFQLGAFDTPQACQNLTDAALQLSHAILTAPHDFSLEIRPELEERALRLATLRRFLYKRGALPHMALRHRRQLAAEAEYVAVAQALWRLYCTALEDNERHREGGGVGIMPDEPFIMRALQTFMYEHVYGGLARPDEDVVRRFFHAELAQMPEFLRDLSQQAHEFLEAGPMATPVRLLGVGAVYIAIYDAALSFRESPQNPFTLPTRDDLLAGETIRDDGDEATVVALTPWTAERPGPDTLVWLYHTLHAFIMRHGGSRTVMRPHATLHQQLVRLAKIVLLTVRDVVAAAARATRHDADADADAAAAVAADQAATAPVLRALAEAGHHAEAVQLAGDFRALSALVALLQQPQGRHEPPDAPERRIEACFERFGPELQTVYFDTLVAQQDYGKLIAASQRWPDAARAFWAARPQLAGLAWLHQARTRDWDAAAQSLYAAAAAQDNVVQKQTALNLSKLAFLASRQHATGVTGPAQRVASTVTAEALARRYTPVLETLELQLFLRAQCLQAYAASPTSQTTPLSTVSNAAHTFAVALSALQYGGLTRACPTEAHLVHHALEQLYRNDVLDVPQLVDLLTLQLSSPATTASQDDDEDDMQETEAALAGSQTPAALFASAIALFQSARTCRLLDARQTRLCMAIIAGRAWRLEDWDAFWDSHRASSDADARALLADTVVAGLMADAARQRAQTRGLQADLRTREAELPASARSSEEALLPSPEDIVAVLRSATTEDAAAWAPTLTPAQQAALLQDWQFEAASLETRIPEALLMEIHHELMHL